MQSTLPRHPSPTLREDAWRLSDRVLDLHNLMRFTERNAERAVGPFAVQEYERAVWRLAYELGCARIQLDEACRLLRLGGLTDTAAEIQARTATHAEDVP